MGIKFCLRIGGDFLNSPILYRVTKPQFIRDSECITREAILFRLMLHSVLGAVFTDASHCAKVTSSPLMQCERVWNICLEDGVLRKTEGGYSALSWLKENGFLSLETDSGKAENASQENQAENGAYFSQNFTSDARAANGAGEPKKLKIGDFNATEPPSHPAHPAHPAPPRALSDRAPIFATTNTYKRPLRTNVFVSDSELEELKSKYSQGQIDKMLDFLSDYKHRSNRTYASDYAAINRWVAKRILDDENAGQKIQELPSWLFDDSEE